jgi:hypothetical protein
MFMSKRNGVSLLLLVTLFVAGCQKEIDFTDRNGSGSGTGGGGNGGGNVSGGSFCPTTVGTWWKYKDSTSGAITTQTIQNTTQTRNGILYKAVTVSGRSDTGWYASPRPGYYLAQAGTDPGTGASYDMVFHYLNDTAAIGYSWEYVAGQGNGFAADMKTTIVEKGLTMTVGGKTYKDVTHTTMHLSYDLGIIVLDAAVYDFYVARGAGIIKIRTNIDALGTTLQTCSDLIDHSIK